MWWARVPAPEPQHEARARLDGREPKRKDALVKNRSVLTLLLVTFFTGCSAARAQSLFTNPVIVVSPMTLDFGAVPKNHTITNTFLVENAGGGRLVGKVSVPTPFKIIDGVNYSLLRNEAQVVTIVYRPSGAREDKKTVQFTGGGGAKATVRGRLAPQRGQ